MLASVSPLRASRITQNRPAVRVPAQLVNVTLLIVSTSPLAPEASPAKESVTELVSVGEYTRDPNLDVAELAAYSAMANMILNLDEVLTKE